MDRETRKKNREAKERKALAILQNEIQSKNPLARKILDRMKEIDLSIAHLTEAIQLDRGDFLKREFLLQLETEKRLIISQTIKRGWPKAYLKTLFANQKSTHHENHN